MFEKKQEEKENEQKKETIQKLGLNAIQHYFEVDVTKFDKDFLRHLHEKAKLGMSFERELNLSKRAVEMNYIRIFRLIAEDKKELKQYIKKSLPKYSPI